MKHLLDTYIWVIDERKITDYLLASSHPAGRAKAGFFQQFGFDATAWEDLRRALFDHAHAARIISAATANSGRSIRWTVYWPRRLAASRMFE